MRGRLCVWTCNPCLAMMYHNTQNYLILRVMIISNIQETCRINLTWLFSILSFVCSAIVVESGNTFLHCLYIIIFMLIPAWVLLAIWPSWWWPCTTVLVVQFQCCTTTIIMYAFGEMSSSLASIIILKSWLLGFYIIRQHFTIIWQCFGNDCN